MRTPSNHRLAAGTRWRSRSSKTFRGSRTRWSVYKSRRTSRLKTTCSLACHWRHFVHTHFFACNFLFLLGHVRHCLRREGIVLLLLMRLDNLSLSLSYSRCVTVSTRAKPLSSLSLSLSCSHLLTLKNSYLGQLQRSTFFALGPATDTSLR